MFSMRKNLMLLITAGALVGLVGGTAYAVQTKRTGSRTSAHVIVDQTSSFSVASAGVWTDVPGVGTMLKVPAGTRRLINVRFNAESFCAGPGFCSVRAIYAPFFGEIGSGPIVELAPQSGTNFAFDSAGGSFEAHGFERTSSTFLGAGDYLVSVQAQRVGGATTMSLDDYQAHFELISP